MGAWSRCSPTRRSSPSSTLATTPSACVAASSTDYKGAAFLGIDAGSTTFKAALIGEDGALLWSYASQQKGDVLGCAKAAVTNLGGQRCPRERMSRSCRWATPR